MSPTLRQRRRQAASVPSVSSLFSASTGGLLRSWLNPAASQPAAPPSLAASTLPRLPDSLLKRDRLLDRLDEWAPVTVLRGRTGTGKTTLIASWLAEMTPGEITPLWVSGPGDGPQGEHFERELSTVIGSASADRPALVRLHTALLAQPNDHKVVLVLDDVGSAFGETGWTDLVALVQRHRQLHLVVCCPGIHPLESIAAAAVSVNTLTVADLMLDRDEVAALAAPTTGPLGVEVLDHLHSASGGWLAVVRTMLEAMDDGDRDRPRQAATQYLRGVLINEIATSPDADDLLRFSLADELDGELIEDVCGRDAASTVIAAFESSGLVERSYRGDVVVFEYAALVRDVLRAAYVDRDPQEAGQFHGQLAACFARRDDPSSALAALRHAVAAREWALAVRIWNRRGLSIAATAPERLRALVRDIPAEIVLDHPGLRIFAATATQPVDDDVEFDSTRRRHAELCARVVDEQLSGLRLADLLYVAAGALTGRRIGAGDSTMPLGDLVDRVSIDVATSKDAPELAERIAWFELQVALTASVAGLRERAARHYRRALDLAGDCGAGFIVAEASALQALEHALDGDAELATRCLHRRDRALDRGRNHPGAVAAGIATALLALDRLDEATLTIELAHLDATPSSHDLWPYLAYLRGQHALHYGEPATMLTKLAAAQRLRPGAPESRSGATATLLARTRADLLIALGLGQRAQAVVGSISVADGLLAVPAARLCLQSGDFEQARLRAGRAAYEDGIGLRDQVELLVIESVAALRAGDHDAARSAFRQALACSAESGIVRAFATVVPDELAELGRLAGTEAEAANFATTGRNPVYSAPLVLIALTKSERALITALEKTGSRREIAETRYVSINTVKTQLRALYQKLGTTSREDTLARIRELGLLA